MLASLGVVSALLFGWALFVRMRYGAWSLIRPRIFRYLGGPQPYLGEWEATERKNEEVLIQLRRQLGAHKVTIFGSSLRGRRCFAPWSNWHREDANPWSQGPSRDVDLMIQVDLATWRVWASEVYGGDPSAPEEDMYRKILAYGGTEVAPTRSPRRCAAAKILGFDLTAIAADLDVFLFPEEFVSGSIDIPAWNDPKRSFRKEVLKGTSLQELRAGKVPLREFI